MPLTIDGQANSITSSTAGVNIPATVDTLSVGPSGSYMIANSSGVGIGTLTPQDKLTVLGKIQIQQNSSSNNRIVLRGQPGSSYRYGIDNNSLSNNFRVFREDDVTGANGAVYMNIDSAGRVTTPYQPSFQAFSSSNTPIGSGTNVLPFNATNFNVGSHYNTSTYRFTAPVAGVYLFSVNLNLYTAPGIMMPAVRINGSSAYYGSRLSGNISGDNNLNLIVLLSLSVNDYVEALSSAQGSSAYISNGADWTRFEGRLLG